MFSPWRSRLHGSQIDLVANLVFFWRRDHLAATLIATVVAAVAVALVDLHY